MFLCLPGLTPVLRLGKKGLVKCHMSASQVLIAATCYTTLVPNDALPDLNFCSQCKPWKPIALNLLLKTFTQLVDARNAMLPQTHLIRYAPKTQDTW